MSTSERCDVLIAGAGCAGLSLAVHLVQADFRGTVRIFDPRTEFGPDRTWCFWNVERHPFEDAVAHRWAHWRVRDTAGNEVLRGGGAYEYCYLPGERFYAAALDLLKRAPNVRLQLGVGVEDLSPQGEEAAARLTNGMTLRASLAFDSRPAPQRPAPRPDDVDWVQHFQGVWIRAPRPCFDPGVATLMDFEVDQTRGMHFLYVLPVSDWEALVESTYFSAAPHPDPSIYQEAISKYLSRLLPAEDVASCEVLRREAGVLPMSTVPPPPSPGPRIVPIGVRGGAAKPSSGYAFLAIQRQSRALAELLVRQGVEAATKRLPVRNPVTQWQDRVFLAHLAALPPYAAAALFLRLFQDCHSDRLARFLSESGTPRDQIHVMWRVPLARFLFEGFRQAGPAWFRRD